MKHVKFKIETGIEGVATPFFHEGYHRRTSKHCFFSLHKHRVAGNKTQTQQHNEYCLISELFSAKSSPKEGGNCGMPRMGEEGCDAKSQLNPEPVRCNHVGF